MTANEPHTGTQPRPTGERVSPVCPECGEPARAAPPREWPLAGFTPRPRYSHHDGTPLCPVVGPDGYTPAEPAATDNTPAHDTPPHDTPANSADTARDNDGDQCRTEGCPSDPNDGDSYDGCCGSCADRHEAAGTWE
jgi:hypothetical protein